MSMIDEIHKELDLYFNKVIENGEQAQRAIDALNVENAKLRSARDMWQENDAKLRELVRHLYECSFHRTCKRCKYIGETCDFEHDMRELGMEVE